MKIWQKGIEFALRFARLSNGKSHTRNSTSYYTGANAFDTRIAQNFIQRQPVTQFSSIQGEPVTNQLQPVKFLDGIICHSYSYKRE